MTSGVHISVSAETIAHIGNVAITNSMLTSTIVSAVIVILSVYIGSRIKQTDHPDRLQSFAEMVVDGFQNFIKGIVETDRKVKLFTPLVMSFFLFIALNNWSGLLPGVGTILIKPKETTHVQIVQPAQASEDVLDTAQDESNIEETHSETKTGDEAEMAGEADSHAETEEKHAAVPLFRAGTADLNMTIALAIISVVMTQVYGLMFLGGEYLTKFFNFSSPIYFFVGILEFVLEFAKIASFAFRLFGNIFAGEVLLEVIKFLVPLVVPMPFLGLEIFVGFVQALVFVMLSIVFFNMATQGHGDHEH